MSVRAPTSVTGGGDGGICYFFDNFDMNESGNVVLCPCGYAGGRYTVGTIHASLKGGTWDAAVLTPQVSNDPMGTTYGAHPSASTITATDTPTVGLATDYWYFGVKVTTPQSAASIARVWIFLSP